jgi:large subunit ribosomal protein L25
VAETYTLDAQSRSITGKQVGALRRSGLIPASIYGAKIDPMNIQIPQRALQITLSKAGGTHVINLNVDGKPVSVLAREVQRHVTRGDIMHVDFFAVDASTRIKAEVRVHYLNDAPAVKANVGVLLDGLQVIEIEALPADLIDRADVDLSSLKEMGDSIHVRDLKLGDKVTVLSDPDEMIVRIAVQAAVDEGTVGEVSSSEPEVIKKGKIDEEGDE